MILLIASTKKLHTNSKTFYFITFTCFKWIPLFEITQLYDFIYEWFKILTFKKVYLIGFVIMPIIFIS